jgi:rhodanese-related sulfurtransferase
VSPDSLARFRRLSAVDAADLIVRHRRGVLPELALFDVRDRKSFDQGHVAGAEHLDDAGLARVLRRVPRRTPVVLYCYHGNASQTYATTFTDFRFSEVYSVDGGFEPLALALEDRGRRGARGPTTVEASEELRAFLSDYGFDASCLDSPRAHGLTPLMRAALSGREDLVEELLRSGADVRCRNADGNNALWLACVSKSAAVVRRLVVAGIDVDNQNDSGATALMYAASSGKAGLVSLLLESGANPALRNQDGFTAIDLASSWECVTVLRPHLPSRGEGGNLSEP